MNSPLRGLVRFLCFAGSVLSAGAIFVALGGKVATESHPVLALVAFALMIFFGYKAVALADDRRQTQFMWEIVAFDFFAAIVAAVLYPVWQGARPAAHKSACLSNVKQLSLGLLVYISDANDRMPPAMQWRTAIKPYMHWLQPLKCPDAKTPWTYAMNGTLSNTVSGKCPEPSSLILLFESDSSTENAFGGIESFVPRHDDHGSIAFLDGSAKRKAKSDPDMRWKP